MDVLPFSSGPGGMWYEIATDTVECVDEVEQQQAGEFAGLGAIEADETVLETRNKSSIRIDIHVAPRAKSVHENTAAGKRKAGGKTRPSAKKRRAMRAGADDEEGMMNA